MQHRTEDELIHKADAAGGGRVVINRFILWITKLTPKDGTYEKIRQR